MSQLELVIDSNLSDVALVAVAVKNICLYLGLDKSGANEVELCVVEAVTNAIKHAYHGNSGHPVSVLVSVSAEELQLEVTDCGTSMAASQVERLVEGTDVVEMDRIDQSSLAESGRGLQIIHDLMDKAAYIKKGNLNCLRLTKYISSPELG
jgi:serine/threonine-protein kinase RsbW